MSPTAASDRSGPVARVAIARAVAAASLAALAAAVTAGILSGDTPVLLLIPALLPLLLFVPAVYRARPRGLALLCFVCLLYFCVIVTRLFAPDADLFDAAALIAVVTLFIAAMLCSRWRRNQPDA